MQIRISPFHFILALIHERPEIKRGIPVSLGDSAILEVLFLYVRSAEAAELQASGKSTNSCG